MSIKQATTEGNDMNTTTVAPTSSVSISDRCQVTEAAQNAAYLAWNWLQTRGSVSTADAEASDQAMTKALIKFDAMAYRAGYSRTESDAIYEDAKRLIWRE